MIIERKDILLSKVSQAQKDKDIYSLSEAIATHALLNACI